MNIDQKAFEYAISQINDGFIFENFCLKFLSAVLGADFVPVGGSKDKGIDGFIHSRKDNEKVIFQISTELTYEDKIHGTVEKLRNNNIEFFKLNYVTNRNINNSYALAEQLSNQYNIAINIWDIKWLTSNCNTSEKTINLFNIFVDTYLHQYSKPGKVNIIANLNDDSRLYVFLGQQFDSKRDDLKLDDLLADTLIIYALEGTDPEKGFVVPFTEIRKRIIKNLKFDPKLIEDKVTERLNILINKPRKVVYHSKLNGYCLPYETRSEIEERNLKDEALVNVFHEQTKETVKKYFKDVDVNVRDVESLITTIFNRIYYKQGLEFSNFVLHGDSHSVIEQNLNEVISSAIDESSVVLKNKEKVKTALHLAIRDIVYNGSLEQRKFLKSLSNTYLMMFLLQWEPKISTYFQSLSSQLKVFVDNSIIVPALSEYYLEEGNKRHWNLLIGSYQAGVSLFINETLLDELVSHFNMIRNKYYSNFSENEDFYLSDEYELLFIDEILIRAYFYAKKGKRVSDFDSFINNFLDPFLKTAKEDLIIYLKETFGITYISNKAWDIKVPVEEKEKLSDVLSQRKHKVKAENDAEMILSVYFLREKNNETSDTGIFGYKTWWLSKDTSTYKAVTEAFPNKYSVSCYIRPDFLFNYIALRPTNEDVTKAYHEIFPTMLGVNLSYHMPREVSETIQQRVKEFHDKPKVRVKQILKALGERLKSDPNLRNKKSVELYLNEELAKITGVKK